MVEGRRNGLNCSFLLCRLLPHQSFIDKKIKQSGLEHSLEEIACLRVHLHWSEISPVKFFWEIIERSLNMFLQLVRRNQKKCSTITQRCFNIILKSIIGKDQETNSLLKRLIHSILFYEPTFGFQIYLILLSFHFSIFFFLFSSLDS